jgi:hypothetical protein
MRRNLLLVGALGFTLLHGQALPSEQKQKVDDAVPVKAPAKPRRPRRMLVSNLAMRDGHPWHGSSYDTIPAANYAIAQMGKRTGAYEAVFSDDVEMFRPDRIKQFDAICFLNTVGVLFEDPELKEIATRLHRGRQGVRGDSRCHRDLRAVSQVRPVAAVRPDAGRDRERRTSLGRGDHDSEGGGPEEPAECRVSRR